MSDIRLFVGVDIAADSASVALVNTTGEQLRVFDITQNQRGLNCLLHRIGKIEENPARVHVVMEATSTYWWMLAMGCYKAGYSVSVVNPAQAHYFVQAQLQRTKTDQIDAGYLAQLGCRFDLPRWGPPSDIQMQVRQRLEQREDLKTAKGRLVSQLHALRRHAFADPTVIARYEHLIDELGAHMDTLEAEIKTLIRHDPAWHDTFTRLLSILGVGDIIAAWLVCLTNNFTTCDRIEELIAYLGLAPHRRESGKSRKGKGRIGLAGNGAARGALHMGALAATTFNPAIKAYNQQLEARGLPHTARLCACSRKLLRQCWAVVTKKTMFDPTYC